MSANIENETEELTDVCIQFISEQEGAVFTSLFPRAYQRLAEELGLYHPLWKPEYLDIETSRDLAPYLMGGLHQLKTRGELFRSYVPQEDYIGLSEFRDKIQNIIEATYLLPEALLKVIR